MPDQIQKGLPGEFLLLFTVSIWVLFFLIRLGNPQNILNRWCFISGMIFSLGVFKEYLYFTLFPWLIRAFPSVFTEEGALTVYSALTGFFYYFSMPPALVFGLYFDHFDRRHPRLFPWLKAALFLPGILFGLFFPYGQTRYFQLNSRPYYLALTYYNVIYGILLSILLIRSLYRGRREASFRQKRMVAVLVLVPLWYWLVSALIVHSLGLTRYFKAWQGNFLIIAVLLIYFIRYAFRGGIMGTSFRRETFDWDKEGSLISRNAHYTQHFFKNQLSKIEWCARNLESSSGAEENRQYARIITHSAERLKHYMERMKYYSQDILLKKTPCRLSDILEATTASVSRQYPGVTLALKCSGEIVLSCDREYMEEVFSNLVNNAVESMDAAGTLTIEAFPVSRQGKLVIAVKDSGRGIPSGALSKIFEPYYSTKGSEEHMGLGLYFCRKVLKKHGGDITVRSTPGTGSTFFLTLPWKKNLSGKEAEQ